MCIAQPTVWFLYLLLPRKRATDIVELVVFIGLLSFAGYLSYRGILPRPARSSPARSPPWDC